MAVESNQKAAAAQLGGLFDAELVPVTVKTLDENGIETGTTTVTKALHNNVSSLRDGRRTRACGRTRRWRAWAS